MDVSTDLENWRDGRIDSFTIYHTLFTYIDTNNWGTIKCKINFDINPFGKISCQIHFDINPCTKVACKIQFHTTHQKVLKQGISLRFSGLSATI